MRRRGARNVVDRVSWEGRASRSPLTSCGGGHSAARLPGESADAAAACAVGGPCPICGSDPAGPQLPPTARLARPGWCASRAAASRPVSSTARPCSPAHARPSGAACQGCNPNASTSGWSGLDGGSSCGDGGAHGLRRDQLRLRRRDRRAGLRRRGGEPDRSVSGVRAHDERAGLVAGARQRREAAGREVLLQQHLRARLQHWRDGVSVGRAQQPRPPPATTARRACPARARRRGRTPRTEPPARQPPPRTAAAARSGVCVDPSSDTSNCGACGHECTEAPMPTCAGGYCASALGSTGFTGARLAVDATNVYWTTVSTMSCRRPSPAAARRRSRRGQIPPG